MLDGFNDRSAVGRCTFGYLDGGEVRFFDGELRGKIAMSPKGENGFGWDKIFIPDGHEITRAEMDNQNYGKVYATIKPFDKLRDFLNNER
jgi:non-canonical purine NTP pyrophosphatase (RdgB/HAM1 family)